MKYIQLAKNSGSYLELKNKIGDRSAHSISAKRELLFLITQFRSCNTLHFRSEKIGILRPHVMYWFLKFRQLLTFILAPNVTVMHQGFIFIINTDVSKTAIIVTRVFIQFS